MLDLPSTHVGERKLVSNQVQPTQLHPEAKAKNGNFSSKSKMSIHLRATFIGAYLVSAVGSLFLFNVLYGDQAYGTVSMEGLSFSAPFETTNPIMKENMMQGTSDWILTNPSLKREIEGYMSHTSVQRGESILLFYNTKSPSVIVEVFRSGYYGGLGARKVLGPVEVPGREQIIPRPDNYGTVSCQWKDPFIVSTQNSWTTGVYLVRMTETAAKTQSYAIFFIRDDARQSDITFQIPFNTYQAYNYWGGRSLYGWGSGGPEKLPWGKHAGNRAFKVSYDRPYARSNTLAAAYGNGAGEYLTNIQLLFPDYGLNCSAGWNYNMVRFLEKNSVGVTYISNIDTHSRLNKITKPKLFLTQGHDEYWSNEMRDHVENLRDTGTHLVFLGSNTAYFAVRMEPGDSNTSVNKSSIPGLAPDENRIIVCFKRVKADPVKNEFRSVPFRQVRPEADMVGVEYVGDPYEEDLIVKNASHWIFHGTGVSDGYVIPGLLGYEVDSMRESRTKNNNIITPVFETPLKNIHMKRKEPILLCHGTIYTSASGANVFGAGTMFWSWGLDDYNVQQGLRPSLLSKVIEKVTWNLFEAAGVKKIRGFRLL
mmetsp:Transcript_29721/g.61103  ORF Transcript_29721/g.61103 Transcript_29721/m.61103 type:complete len:593 (-) Transcript_29721:240-2018(-)